MRPITLLSQGSIILVDMVFLAAFARLSARKPVANEVVAEAHAALGHLGLTVIALVFILISFWKA